MSALALARIQFAFTIAFHYIYPPLSIGLSLLLVLMEGTYLRTRNPLYLRLTRFWARVFGLVFAIGVATGVVMEFEFGTNWSTYSRYVGDVFGSALASEGIFAFFLESGFLALLLFGWDRVSRKVHFLSTCLVCLGAHFSAIWIVVANSWMQTPAGFHIVGEGLKARAEITDFWAMVFNPSALDRISHVYMGAWQAGVWLVLSVSAYYLLKGKHLDFAKAGLRLALPVALLASIAQLVTGHASARLVSQYQPAKLAAMEAHYDSQSPADLYLVGWVKEQEERAIGLKIPGGVGLLLQHQASASFPGLNDFSPQDRPPVQGTFQSYHLMVIIGMTLIGLSLVGTYYAWRTTLYETRWLLWGFVFAVLGPQVANQAGWFTAELGRQPWIVYGLLRTSEGLSKVVQAHTILASLILFAFIYVLLFAVFIYLLNEKIQHGPDEEPPPSDSRLIPDEARAS